MRKVLMALWTITGLIGLGAVGASAAATAPSHAPPQAFAVQKADWYCGPRCQYWHQRRQAHRWYHHYSYYGYR